MAEADFVLLMCIILRLAFQTQAEPLIFLDSNEIIFMNRTYGEAEITLGKLENGLNAMNVSLNVTKKIPEDVLISFKLFKFDEDMNNYTQVYDMTKDLCDLAENEYQVIFGEYLNEDGFLKNFLKKCPIEKGHYYFINGCVPNANYPWIPYWKVKTTTKVFTDAYNILEVDTYAHIEDGNMDNYKN